MAVVSSFKFVFGSEPQRLSQATDGFLPVGNDRGSSRPAVQAVIKVPYSFEQDHTAMRHLPDHLLTLYLVSAGSKRRSASSL